MRSVEEYRQILSLWEQGHNKSEIERMTGIPRLTARDCIARFGSIEGLEKALSEKASLARTKSDYLFDNIKQNDEAREQYAYLLGLYLGDGHIVLNKNGRSYRIRIFLDQKYPKIVEACHHALTTVFFNNKSNQMTLKGCYEVYLDNKHIPELFPQHGEGHKHLRKIALEDWQQAIIEEFPLAFFRGLYHSDGSRAQNIVKGKDYRRYIFTNMSQDITDLFTQTCDRLSLHWTEKAQYKHVGANSVFISRREDVERLDELVGAKA